MKNRAVKTRSDMTVAWPLLNRLMDVKGNGASGETRTLKVLPPVDFESTASTIPPHSRPRKPKIVSDVAVLSDSIAFDQYIF